MLSTVVTRLLYRTFSWCWRPYYCFWQNILLSNNTGTENTGKIKPFAPFTNGIHWTVDKYHKLLHYLLFLVHRVESFRSSHLWELGRFAVLWAGTECLPAFFLQWNLLWWSPDGNQTFALVWKSCTSATEINISFQTIFWLMLPGGKSSTVNLRQWSQNLVNAPLGREGIRTSAYKFPIFSWSSGWRVNVLPNPHVGVTDAVLVVLEQLHHLLLCAGFSGSRHQGLQRFRDASKRSRNYL